MTDIVAFLNARLDEDEAIATAAKWKNWVPGSGLYPPSVETSEPQPGWHGLRATVANLMATVGKDQRERQHATHIARHDPARVLREVAAKRRTMARHYADDDGSCVGCHFANDETRWAETIEECPELRDMASVYSDHPDYEQSWSVE